MKVVDYRDWPKQNPLRCTGMVASISADFDAIAASLFAKPKMFTQRATRTEPQTKSRGIFFVLSNRVPAALIDCFSGDGKLELHLQVVRDEFVFEEDFNEVISTLKIDPENVQKFSEVYVTWLPNRKAKMVRRKEEPLQEDWWNRGASR